MIANGLTWIWNRLRPSEGWLAFFLLGTAITFLVVAVIEADWVPEDGVIFPTALGGFLLSVILAKRPLRRPAAWLLITLYGFLITFINLANLRPPLTVLTRNDMAITQYWRQNGALFGDKVAGWLKAVFSGGSSQETIVFAIGLGLLAWFLAAFAGWSTFRGHQPLQGLTVMGVAITVNSYFGGVELYWSALFVGIAAVITAVLHYAHLEQAWDHDQIDYSDEVRNELIIYSTVIAVVLFTISLTLPNINLREMAQWFQSQTAVQEAEDALGRAFAGVRQPQRPASPGGVGGSGILPRSYLIGKSPDLSDRVMMRAHVSQIIENGIMQTASPQITQGLHWRGLSYDVYTGRGWALSEERQEAIAANQVIPITPVDESIILSQAIQWKFDNRVIRYTLGLPQQFDQATTVNWRGIKDLSRVQSEEAERDNYTVTTQTSAASPSVLRTAAIQNVPPAILARYTTLPGTTPQRIFDLAQEVAGQFNNPYDQARALEQFLRQYPYSLDVPLPPDGADPVDYFLFDLQAGYCDYYASSMVVMARTLGLPARIGVGYLSQPPDTQGFQTIYQINAHSWAEVYFAGYGWIEFEPTAPFTSRQDAILEEAGPTDTVDDSLHDIPDTVSPPIPERVPTLQIAWRRIAFLLVIVFLIGGVLVVQQQQNKRKREQDMVGWVYGRLHKQAQHLGQIPTPSQTPSEFSTAFIHHLYNQFQAPSRFFKPVALLANPIKQLTQLYQKKRYAEEKGGGDEQVLEIWRKLKRPFLMLRLRQMLQKNDPQK